MKKIFKVFTLLFSFLFISLLLASCEGKGKIVIKEPPHAKVYINGKYVGETPIELELREGSYDITVEKDPFISETKKDVQVFFDRTLVLKFNPTPKGILEVNSLPKDAQVWDKRVYLGNTPLKVKLDPGLHDIYLYKGKLSAERKVNIEYRKTKKLFVNLEKAVLHVYANPSDAVIKIGNITINKFPSTVELDEGTYKVIVSKKPYEDQFTLKVKKGDELRITYELRPVQLPPVQAYGPIKFTHNGKYLVSMGKAGIYFWDINKFKPQISLYDPEDVRNFDKFINFNISKNDEFVVGIKPIRKLAYALKTKEKMDKILIWDLRTTAVKFSKLFSTQSKYAFFKDKSNIYLIEKNGKIDSLNSSTGKISSVFNLNTTVTAANQLDNNILIGTKDGYVEVFDMSSNSVVSKHKLPAQISDIQISKDKSNIYIASDKVYIFDKQLSNKKVVGTETKPLAVAVTPDRKYIAVSYGKTVKAYDLLNGKTLYSINNLPADIISMKFKDEHILITASGIKTPYIGIWKDGHLLRKWVQTIE